MFNNMKDKLLQQYLAETDPEELMQTLDTILPQLLARFTSQEKTDFLLNLMEKHLSTILEGLTKKERGELLTKLLPTLLEEFPLDEIDLLTLAN